MSDHEESETTSHGNFDSSVGYLGRVKWFNNKAGYGFVTVVGEGTRSGSDIFVHHSGVNTGSEQYKYLVQGEYVSFVLKRSDNSAHPFQASNVTGVHGGKLMCETRAEQRQQREEHENTSAPRDRKAARQSFRLHGSGPREEGAVWTLVREDRGGKQDNSRHRNQKSTEHQPTQDA